MKVMIHFKLAAITAVLMLAASPAMANIYIHDTFDDGTAFENVGWWAINNTDEATLADVNAYQGINVRSDGVGVPGTHDPANEPVVMNFTGTVTNSMAFSGRSVQLASGQEISVVNRNAYAYPSGDWWKVHQFAVAVDADTLALPDGTVVGHFQQDFNDDEESTAAELIYKINFVRSGSGVNIVVDNNGVVIGSITAADQWHVISVLSTPNANEEDPLRWEAYDPLAGVYKGPQPVGDPYNNPEDIYPQPGAFYGIGVFVNSNTEANRIPATDLLPVFSGEEDNTTYLVGWEIRALGGGNLYIDNLFWSHGLFQDGKMAENRGTQEGALRLMEFDAEAEGPAPNATRHWTTFQ